MKKIARPAAGEYLPFSIAYISKVPEEGLLTEYLSGNAAEISNLLASLSEEKLCRRYAEGKWNLKEVLGHIIDTERVFSYRALCIARNDQSAFPGFDQDDYAQSSNAGNRSMGSLLHEYAMVRAGTIALLESFDDAAWLRKGFASNHTLSVRAAAYQIVGHELHHLAIIRERYL